MTIIIFLKKTVLFALVMTVIFLAYLKISNMLLNIVNGPSTENQIDQQFANAISHEYKTIVLGNSRVYRGINPDFLDSAYNFAHDNDNFNQIYYKLNYVLSHGKKIKYLIFGIDYFQFSFLSDTRNYSYRNYLGTDYLKDYNNNQIDFLFAPIDNNRRNTKSVITACYHIINGNKHRAYLRDNGQYIFDTQPTEKDTIVREYTILPLQLDYFHKIIALCQESEITVFMIMLPLRPAELNSYPSVELLKIEKIFQNVSRSNLFYLNFSRSSNYSIVDFSDITHLNREGADKFSMELKDSINLILSRNF